MDADSDAPPRIIIRGEEGGGETVAYACAELAHFLGGSFPMAASGEADWHIHLAVDPGLPREAFCIRCLDRGGQTDIRLTGGEPSAVLAAAYTFLERLGIRFEITGPVLPAPLSRQPGRGAETIIPRVSRRGIRQHLNFPMDLSSYPLPEALEYVRNVARLRFNQIVFHSYRGQWHESQVEGKVKSPGNFFYGQLHPLIPGEPTLAGVRNRAVFCIPEIEPFFEDPGARARLAVEWLRAVIRECRRVGLRVRFSFEPGSGSRDVSATAATVRWILENYPGIGEIELITEETGGWGESSSAAEAEQALLDHFGPEALADRAIAAPIRDGQPSLAQLYAQIGHNIRALKAIDEPLLRPRGIGGVISLYVTVPEYLGAAFRLVRRYAPEFAWGVLPAHGVRRVTPQLQFALQPTQHPPSIEALRQEWSRTMIYSWLEFDGIMYLQQNAVRGIRQLIEHGEDVNGRSPIGGICFNHWRTAENRTAARYAAVATLHGAPEEGAFYRDYAAGLGIRPPAAFAAAMKGIDDADWFATTDLPNVGFCAVGVWGERLGYFGWHRAEALKRNEDQYARALRLIGRCLRGSPSPAAREYLSLLDNRLQATVAYLQAFRRAAELREFYAMASPTETDRAQAAAICDQGLALFHRYAAIHAELMPDRGSEGTLISFLHTPIAFLKRIRGEITGAPPGPALSPDPASGPPNPIVFGSHQN